LSSTACLNLKLCVAEGLEAQVTSLGLGRAIVATTGQQSLGSILMSGMCNAVAGSFFDVIPAAIRNDYAGGYEVGVNRFSPQPLSLVTRQDDPQWSQLVYWINAGLFHAEERGITQRTAVDAMPTVETFGPLLRNIFRQSVNAVGNYGEVYARHVQGEAPRGGPHELNDLSGPQLYPSPGLFSDFDSSQRRTRRELRRLRK
jgi:general L-amino acid transport system substrate-binding protein